MVGRTDIEVSHSAQTSAGIKLCIVFVSTSTTLVLAFLYARLQPNITSATLVIFFGDA
jgi:hypothetical protein